MKRSLVLGLLAILAVCGCHVKEESEFAPKGKSFTATMEATVGDATDIGTKTSLDNLNVLWTLGDQVSIFAGSTINERYQVTDASDGKATAALNRVTSPGFVAGGELSTNVAYYPYTSTASITKSGNNYVISDIALPATQDYADDSFGNGAFPMAAVTSSTNDLSLKFKNVLGSLKLQLKGTATITSISVTGNNDEKLCGAASVTVSNTGTPAITLTDATATTVTLDCGDGVLLDAETATAFIIALPPMTMAGGFTVVVYDSQGASMEIKTTRSQTIARSNLLKMPAVTYVGTAPVVPPVPEAVDLGLPSGIKWATFNLGAGAPEEYGDYYAWGETEPYYESLDPLVWKTGKEVGYYWQSYRFGTYNTLTKYNLDSDHGSVIDNKTRLELSDDAANASWGGAWRIPTKDEWDELIATKANTSSYQWELKTVNGHDGWEVKYLANGNSIFLPITGVWSYDDLSNGCCYWSSSLVTGGFDGLLAADPQSAWTAWIEQDCSLWPMYRIFGCPVRPVTDEDVLVSVTGISLDKSSMALDVEEESTVTATVSPSNATKKDVIWSSSDRSVATVSWEGVVTAVAAGHATITATTYDGGFTATCAVTVQAIPEAVDLGLPSGRKWATFNLGAIAPEDYGDYYAWGETEPDSDYSWASYQWCDNGNGSVLTRYNTKGYGTVDHRTDFICYGYEDDAARASWGDGWRMPTIDEWQELIDNCTSTWTTRNGVTGDLLTGPNGNSIFLPAAGYRRNSNSYRVGTTCDYWSSSLDKYTPTGAMGLNVSASDMSYDGYYHRYLGLAVRPVKDDSEWVPVTGISLPLGAVSLTVGQTYSMNATVSPSNATHKHIVWKSYNTSVASITWEGKVMALSAGTATIVGTTCDGDYSASYQAVVKEHEAVDLGLTSGIKWANCNVGAFAADEYGDYFAWGETEPYYMSGHSQDNPCSDWRSRTNPAITGYDWASYKWCNGSSYTLTKYNKRGAYGTIDNKTVLDLADDAAYANWGGSWRMPTEAEWTELRAECLWTWKVIPGVVLKYGYEVTGPNGNSIFLPAAGYRNDTYIGDSAGTIGYYWTSSLYTDYPYEAYHIGFRSSLVAKDHFERHYGLLVRPVKD